VGESSEDGTDLVDSDEDGNGVPDLAGDADESAEGNGADDNGTSDEAPDAQVKPDWAEGIAVEDVYLRPKAVPYFLSFNVGKEQLDARFDAFFRKNRKSLYDLLARIANGMVQATPQQKNMALKTVRRFRKLKVPASIYEMLLGGKVSLYGDVLHAFTEREITQRHPDQEVLLYNGLSLREDGESYVISVVFFFVPDVTVRDDFDPLAVDLEEVITKTDAEIDADVDRRMEASRTNIITSVKEGPVEEGDACVCSIVATLEGKPYAPASAKNLVLFTGEATGWESPFKPYAFLLIGSKEGDEKVLNVLWKEGDQDPIRIDMHVHVTKVYLVNTLPADLAAKKHGFPAAEAWRADVYKHVKAATVAREKEQIEAILMAKMAASCMIGPFPDQWILSRTADVRQVSVENVSGDLKRLCTHLGIDSEDQIDSTLANRLMFEAKRNLFLRTYGRLAGIGGPSSFNDVTQYVAAVLTWAHEHLKFEHVTTETIRERQERHGNGLL
jgi:FKBP-type peptidyl-prolyl cis-trans isomerase (trigger factor)